MSSRMARLEDQMVDIQVALGTLQSLVRNGGGAGSIGRGDGAPPQTADGDMAGRVQALESQIGALTAQIDMLNRHIGQGDGTTGNGRSSTGSSESGGGGWQPLPQTYAPPPASPPPSPSAGSRPAWQADENDVGDPRDLNSQRLEPLPQSAPGPSQDADSRETRWSKSSQAAATGTLPFAVGESAYSVQEKTAPGGDAATASGDARSLYDEAYGNLLRKDYASAERGFRRLLEAYPQDAVESEAQYWLGESLYARGNYRESADAFLKGYRDRPKSRKAGVSLLKLGMSLAKLGQKDAACASLGEVTAKFSDPDLEIRAEAERKRTAC